MDHLLVIGVSSRKYCLFTIIKTDGDRYPSIWYNSVGKDFGKTLWEETMREFEPFGVAKIIED